jgi:hypothetical protein
MHVMNTTTKWYWERESKAYMSPLFFKPILFAGVVKVEGGLWFAGSVNFN